MNIYRLQLLLSEYSEVCQTLLFAVRHSSRWQNEFSSGKTKTKVPNYLMFLVIHSYLLNDPLFAQSRKKSSLLWPHLSLNSHIQSKGGRILHSPISCFLQMTSILFQGGGRILINITSPSPSLPLLGKMRCFPQLVKWTES